MCVESAYYDTCIFLQSQNDEHKEHEACRQLIDTSRISWTVSCCLELSAAESTVEEYLNQFEIGCALHGVDLRRISLGAAKAVSKENRGLEKSLRLQGFTGNDWNHLMAAVAVESMVLLTTDPDYWDPRNKSQPKAKKQLVEVKRVIEATLPIKIRLPSEVLGCCT
jgi:hypothetical protein